MSDPVAAVRAAIDTITKHGDEAAVRIAHALDSWIRGGDFEASLGLAPGWRQRIQQATRQTALDALIPLHPGLDDQPLARLIVAGIEDADIEDIRPDGERGHFHDLAKAGVHLTVRTWRQVIADQRGRTAIGFATKAMRVWSRSKLEK